MIWLRSFFTRTPALVATVQTAYTPLQIKLLALSLTNTRTR